jgi:hypothetical protein
MNLSKINKIIIEIHPHIIGKKKSSGLIELILSKGFEMNFDYTSGTVWVFER